MDELSFITLSSELRADVAVALDALVTAKARFAMGTIEGMEACAFHLSRGFNVIEMISKRIATAFENHIDNTQGWHSALVQRMSLAIPGIRPALYTAEMNHPLQRLRGFRHVFNHAYNLELNRDELTLVVGHAGKLSHLLAPAVENFIAGVNQANGWPSGAAIYP